MSGVVYGLFGYVWIKSKLDPGDGFQIDPTIAMIMFVFFVICFTGIFGGVANWAHAGGLVVAGLGVWFCLSPESRQNVIHPFSFKIS